MRTLSPHEARVLATLMEKARTVPDSYPLSLNALLLGCNQKTSRDPVMELSETDAMQAIDALKAQSLVFEASSSRVARFEHNFQRGYGVNEPQAVLLGLLMLRGSQTPGELRISCERWYKFADIGGVESALEELKARADDNGAALVTQLPRAPGMREQRWAHLLCGEASFTAFNQQIRAHNAMNSIATDSLSGQTESLEQRISQLETQLAQLQSRLTYVCEELGLSQS